MLIGMPRAPDPGELPYTEIAPPGDLAPYVDRLWLRTTVRGVPGRIHRVLPDGCVDVIVHADRGATELVGAMTRAAEIPDGPAELVAVRFKPGTAAAITRGALAELTDQNPELAEFGIADDLAGRIVDARAHPAAPLLAAKIPLSVTSHARLAALVAWLRRRLADAAPPDPLVARAVALLSTGAARVDVVAGALGVTRQYLARGFRREVGITPKQLARIARMQRTMAAIRGRARAPARLDLARLAVELGYFDQAHLCNELRALIGVTPAAVVADPPIVLTHLFGEPR